MSDEEATILISHNLRRLRKDLSLAEVARRANTYPTTIKQIEDGERMPGVGLLTRIAEAFEVEISEFLMPVKKI